MKAVIIDDESNNSELINNLLKLYCENVQVAGIADSVQSGYKAILEHKPDLIFLDVQMQDGTGFDLLKCFETIDFKVIFVTAHQEFAIEAFKISALDYLLKPLSPAHVITAVKKAEQSLENEELQVKLQALLGNVSEPAKNRRKIVLKTLDRIYSVGINEIIRFESEGNYTKIFLADGKKIMVSRLLKEFDELLTNDGFARIHQSHLINTGFMFFFEKAENILVMKDESRVPVSARKKELVLGLLNSI
ncbi:MAG: DNA-binding response regulator [Bacteroidetes bacterium]|jgi:two-component system LytT family response regulator|nr:DNA-binding response regulator [Bacteroidota bacterium]